MSRLVAPSRANVLKQGIDQSGAFLRERELYSVVAYATNGTSPNGDTVFRFFNQNFNPAVTNIKAPNKLTSSELSVQGMGFEFVTSTSEIVADVTPIALSSAKTAVLESGYILAKRNGVEIIEGLGLNKWPQGNGVDISAAGYSTASTVTAVVSKVNNGAPNWMNRRMFVLPFQFLSDDVFELEVRFTTAISLPSGVTGSLRAYLWGIEGTSIVGNGNRFA
jgi:hypothetical protein